MIFINIAEKLNEISEYTKNNEFDKIQELTISLEKNILDNYKSDADFKRLIDSLTIYSDYSFFNSLLIDYQYPDFLDLNTKQKYLKNGIDITNPEKVIKILSPNNDVYVKIKKNNREEIKLINDLTKEELSIFNDSNNNTITFDHKDFKGLNILELFDCKDTTMPLNDYKSFDYPALLGSNYNDIYNSFVKAIYSFGYKVKYVNNLDGKFSLDKETKTINIRNGLNSKIKILSMIEVYTNDVTNNDFDKDLLNYVICKGIGIENNFDEKYSFLDWYKNNNIKSVDTTFKLISSKGRKFIKQFNKFYSMDIICNKNKDIISNKEYNINI